jgi:hypothetical protein
MEILRRSAEARRWVVRYPDHSHLKHRYDVLVNQVIIGVFVLAVIYVVVRRLVI